MLANTQGKLLANMYAQEYTVKKTPKEDDQISVRVDPELKKAFAKKVIDAGVSQTKAVELLVADFVRGERELVIPLPDTPEIPPERRKMVEQLIAFFKEKDPQDKMHEIARRNIADLLDAFKP